MFSSGDIRVKNADSPEPLFQDFTMEMSSYIYSLFALGFLVVLITLTLSHVL